MHKRSDLLELTNEALIALSNVGFVKRATKDLAAGQFPALEIQDDLSLLAQFEDGHRVLLPEGKGLREANCSCPASGMCRHRVTLVLAYQAMYKQSHVENAEAVLEEHWEFSEFRNQIQALPKTILNKANRLIANRIIIQLNHRKLTDEPPSAKLPMCDVRFFSKNNLAHAKCDCIENQICEHIVIAVWAFEQAGNDWFELETMTLELHSPSDVLTQVSQSPKNIFDDPNAKSFETCLNELINQIWMEGSAQPQSILVNLFAQAINLATKLGWYWVIELLIGIRALIEDQHNRSTRYHPSLLLSNLTNLTARIEAAKQMASLSMQSQIPKLPASEILGYGIKGEVKLGHTKLISLGARFWSDEQYEGVKLIFIDPDTQAVMNMVKQWPKGDEEEEHKISLHDRKMVGTSLKKLVSSQIITNAAKRLANGIIEISSNKQNTTTLPLSVSAWEQLCEPIRQLSAHKLRTYLIQSNPDFVRPKQITDQLFILPVTQIIDWGWDAALHRLEIQIISAEQPTDDDVDNTVYIQFQYDPISPNAIDVLASCMLDEASKPRLISGTVKLKSGKLYLDPLTVISDDSVHVLYSDNSKPFNFDRFKDLQQHSQIELILSEIEILLVRCLETGIRYQNQKLITELTLLSKKIEEQGFSLLARQLISAIEMLYSDDKKPLAKKLSFIHQQVQQISKRLVH